MESEEKRKKGQLLFRLEKKWYAVEAKKVGMIENLKKIQSLPHRRSSVFKGIANISGQLIPCINLGWLLQGKEKLENPHRTVVIEQEELFWAFNVEEVKGIEYFSSGKESEEKYITETFEWQKEEVKQLNIEKLIKRFERECKR